MTEELKQQVAVFRFGVIHELVGSTWLDHGEKAALLRDKCARKWEIPGSTRTRISRNTILRWVRTYLAHGRRLEALYPRGRNDVGQSRAIDEEAGLSLLALRRECPKLPVPELVRVFCARQNLCEPGQGPSLSTVYRFLHQHDLMAPAGAAPEDRRKFEAELPNDLWQSDVMHGPLVEVGDKRRKSYLIAFLDDHSRLIAHGAFYPSEGLGHFLEAFSLALAKRGLPRKLYVDNGAAFRSRQLAHTTAALGIALIHARPYLKFPDRKNKIRRNLHEIDENRMHASAYASMVSSSV